VNKVDLYLEYFQGYQVKCLVKGCNHRETRNDKKEALKEREEHKQEHPGHQVLVSFHEYEADDQSASESSEVIKLEEASEVEQQ
jgi:hypothetical protein